MTQEDIDNQKRIEHYAASVNAWFNSSLEHDKSILTLSAGGIGLLFTLLTTVGLQFAEALVLYISAIASFVVALISILTVFRRNQTYLAEILLKKRTDNDPVLTRLDVTAKYAFGAGVLFTAIIGISAAIHSYTLRENVMTNETKKSTDAVPLRESFNGATNSNPEPILQRVSMVPAICNPRP
ncbi:MAG: hypothetical protein ACXW34_04220 [Nitrospira sp.]